MDLRIERQKGKDYRELQFYVSNVLRAIFGKKKISHTERAEDNSTVKASQGLPRPLLTFPSSSLCVVRFREKKSKSTNLQLANTAEKCPLL